MTREEAYAVVQENALAGEIIISENTYQLVKDVFVTEPLEPRKIKGYNTFGVMYRVNGIVRHSK